MAALKIWSIGKANTRIEELETQLAALTVERDTAVTALASNSGEVSTAAEQLQRDLDTARQSISTITGQLNAANAAVAASAAEIATLNARLAGQAETVRVQVAQQLAQTQAQLGAPPLAAAPANAKASDKKGMDRVHAAAIADLAAGGYRPN